MSTGDGVPGAYSHVVHLHVHQPPLLLILQRLAGSSSRLECLQLWHRSVQNEADYFCSSALDRATLLSSHDAQQVLCKASHAHAGQEGVLPGFCDVGSGSSSSVCKEHDSGSACYMSPPAAKNGI